VKTVLEGLERFRHWTTQRQIYSDLPSLKDIKSDDRVDIWLSKHEGLNVVVKMWKREAWGDRQSEAPRLLAFLEKAEALRQSPPPACATIRKVCWIPDAIVILQDFISAKTLEEVLLDAKFFETPNSAVCFVKKLAERVTALHQVNLAHGDLKPSNIMMEGQADYAPILVDLLDLTAAADGEVVSTAYAPPAGGDRFARDRFAVTKMAEEVLSSAGVVGPDAVPLARAIDKCRSGPPENATLLPLIEQLDLLLNPSKEVERRLIRLSIKGATTGSVHSDEGYFGFRMHPDRPVLFVRGASEELGIRLDDRHQPVAGWRSEIAQKRISTVSRFEFAKIEMDIELQPSSVNDFSELLPVISEPTFQSAWKERARSHEYGGRSVFGWERRLMLTGPAQIIKMIKAPRC
jgi:serine/threonine protein kinase